MRSGSHSHVGVSVLAQACGATTEALALLGQSMIGLSEFPIALGNIETFCIISVDFGGAGASRVISIIHAPPPAPVAGQASKQGMAAGAAISRPRANRAA